MGDVLQFGGKKYQKPENMQERVEFTQILRDLNVVAMKVFIEKNLPELVSAGWLEKTSDELVLLMHELRAQYMYLGEEYYKSRNILKAKQFGYCPVEALKKPLCNTCKFFRTPPKEGELACMHLGAIPQDISCPGYETNTP